MKWFLFEHPIATPPQKDRIAIGFIAAHLSRCDPPSPACGMPAVHRPLSSEPAGFIPACCACLALSENHG